MVDEECPSTVCDEDDTCAPAPAVGAQVGGCAGSRDRNKIAARR